MLKVPTQPKHCMNACVSLAQLLLWQACGACPQFGNQCALCVVIKHRLAHCRPCSHPLLCEGAVHSTVPSLGPVDCDGEGPFVAVALHEGVAQIGASHATDLIKTGP